MRSRTRETRPQRTGLPTTQAHPLAKVGGSRALRPQRLDVLATFGAAITEDVHRTARQLTREGWPTGNAIEVVTGHYLALVNRAAVVAAAELVDEVTP